MARSAAAAIFMLSSYEVAGSSAWKQPDFWRAGTGCQKGNNDADFLFFHDLQQCFDACLWDPECKSIDWSVKDSEKRCHVSYSTEGNIDKFNGDAACEYWEVDRQALWSQPSFWQSGTGCLTDANAVTSTDVGKLEECQYLCYRDPQCVAIDWVNKDGDKRCHLSYTTGAEASAFNGDGQCDYWEIQRGALTARVARSWSLPTGLFSHPDFWTTGTGCQTGNNDKDFRFFRDINECFDACLWFNKCKGIDWVVKNGEKRCFVSYESEGNPDKFNGDESCQYFVVDRGVMWSQPGFWTDGRGCLDDSNDATTEEYQKREECQYACYRDPRCVSIDWVPEGENCHISYSAGQNAEDFNGDSKCEYWEIERGPTPRPTPTPTEATSQPTSQPSAQPTVPPGTPTVQPTAQPTLTPTVGASDANFAKRESLAVARILLSVFVPLLAACFSL